MLKISLFFLFGLIPFSAPSQTYGCTDELAKNYNPKATVDDGSCRYKRANIKPESSVVLQDSIAETSGLMEWNGLLWTHNDNPGNTLFGIDSVGIIKQKIDLGIRITEWEAIAQDSAFLYIGDFGNNSRGNRQDLRIFRINKMSVLADQPIIDTISFTYSDQTDLSKSVPNQTNFDCEAFVVTSDSIYLFTKQWQKKETSLYVLPKIPGQHIATLISAFDVNGLITDAVYLESQKQLVLCGYSNKLKPFLYVFYGFQQHDFFSGHKRKVFLKLPFHQVEGMAHDTEDRFYLTNEKFQRKPFIHTQPKLHLINLEGLLPKL